MSPDIKQRRIILTGLMLTEIPFPLWASPAQATVLNNNGLIYMIFSALWVLIIALLIVFYRSSGKKFSKQATQLQTNIEKLRTRINYFRQHTNQFKKEQIEKLREEEGQLDISLKAMQETLTRSKQTSRRNSILLSNISHTLRTNLNDILGFSSLLGTEFAMNEEEDLFEYSENIRKSGESLLHLLNNIIDISRIEAKTLTLKPENCDLKTITREIIASYEGLAKQKGIKIVFQDDGVPQFSGDGQSLRHILSNLIDNAVKYTEKGFVKIRQARQGDRISWTIKDTGEGIDKAYLPDIFEPFRRHSLGYSQTTYQGAGLGLPLVKQLLSLMHGEIKLESQKAVGTTVQVSLPFNPPLAEDVKKDIKKEQHDPSVSLPISKIKLIKPLNRLLIADNDRMNNMLIKKMLPNTGEISFAGSDRELLQKLEQSVQQKQLFELIILEINFQVPSGGIKWLGKIPEVFPEYAHTPLIALSSFPELDEESKILKKGFNAYISKPLNKEKFYNSINKALYS